MQESTDQGAMVIERVGYKHIVHIDGKTITFGDSVSEQYIRRIAPILLRRKKGKG